jgi:hypothetical protein
MLMSSTASVTNPLIISNGNDPKNPSAGGNYSVDEIGSLSLFSN